MPRNNRTVSSMPIKDRLSLRLGLLFAAVFAAVFVGGLVYDIFASIAERSETDAVAQPAPVVIDPKIKTDLAKALAFDVAPADTAISDPFVDRSGISNLVRTTGAAPVRTVAGSSSPGAAPTAAGTAASGRPSIGQSAGSSGSSGTVASLPEVPASEATRTRYEDRMQKIRLGIEAGPESYVFAVDDLLPVGVVSGGSGEQEIIFYSQSADRTFSFAVGTRFFDGWLSELRPEGVVFTIDDRYRTTKMRSWGRSIKAAGMAANVPYLQESAKADAAGVSN